MNGYELAAVVVVSVAVVVVAGLWAMVRIGQQAQAGAGAGMRLVELSGGEDAPVRRYTEPGRPDLRRQVAEAAERARRECEGGL